MGRSDPLPESGRQARVGGETAFDRLIELLVAEAPASKVLLDIGTGTGRLALALAPDCRRVVGLDRDPGVVEEARARARSLGLAAAEFHVVDVEAVEYVDFAPDLIGAHLCVSDSIIERAGRALRPGGLLAFVAFHPDQWRETGRRSRFAYDEAQAERVVTANGFAIEHLEVDRQVQSFASVEEALAVAVSLQERWKADGRWFRYLQFLEKGGRTLTRSHLLCSARRH
jgi:SAM-dependent methyltransferase